VLALFKRGLSAAALYRTHGQRELRIARGTVVDQLDTGLVLNCSGWIVQSVTRPGVYAGDGRGMNALYANLVDAHEQVSIWTPPNRRSRGRAAERVRPR
jgi:hypothetical protein